MVKTRIFAVAVSLLLSFSAWAQRRSMPEMRTLPKQHPKLSYDLSGSTGTYNDTSYTEIQLGLNWYVLDWLNWRNAIFHRMGSKIDSVTGLDSALLATTEFVSEGGGLGVQGFIGPGYRFASTENSAVFGQAGLIFALGGLRVGIGAKSLYYTNPPRDSSGVGDAPRNDNQVYLILGGGGTL